MGSALALLFLVLAAHSRCDASAIGIGINYNWWKFTLMSPRECKAEGEPRTVGVWMLQSYDRPAVRQAVRTQLQQMRHSGFTTMRIIVFYGHDSDPDPSAFTSMTGDVAPADKAKLRDFVADIAAAGFKSLEVAPDFGAENALYCRNREWGDCFDARRTGENWRFISQVAQTAFAAAGSMPVRVDLANEQAPDPSMPARTLEHAKVYLQTIAGRFDARFGKRWVISAARSAHSAPAETGNRLKLLLADLAEARLVPRYLELHEYSDDGNDVKQSLDAMEALAESIDAHVILGELRYHSIAQAAALSQWIAQNPRSRLIDLIQWPEYDPSRSCEINPSPPYTPGTLGAIH